MRLGDKMLVRLKSGETLEVIASLTVPPDAHAHVRRVQDDQISEILEASPCQTPT